MLTGGTKTVYSWDTDKGGMSQKTETVKSHSGVLKNPLINLNIDFYLCCSAGYFGVDGAIAAVIQSFCD
jgi:hypothetical protein